MRVLITGATGFVGRHLTRLCLARDATVVGVARAHRPLPPLEENDTLSYRPLDLLAPHAVRGLVREAMPDVVFHLAADASVRRSWDAPAATLRNNLLSTAHLLEAIRFEAPDARVQVACSGEQYGPVAPDRLPITEGEPLQPRNPYAVSKVAVDYLGGFYADAHGLSLIRTRAFNHAGPGQSDVYVVSGLAAQVAVAESSAADHVRLRTGNIDVRRDFTDVRDVVKAYWLLAERGYPGAYNVASGRSVPLHEIVSALDANTRLEVVHSTDPDKVRRHEVMDLRGSSDKLRRTTGWRPEIDLQTTVSDVLAWWRAELEGKGPQSTATGG